jgi:hypothetical protein
VRFSELKFEPHPLLAKHEVARHGDYSIIRGPLTGLEVYRFSDEERWAFLREDQAEDIINGRME